MPTFIRLTDYKSSEEKEKGFFKPENRYEAKQEDFEKIPGSPIAYWVSDKFKELIVNKKIASVAFSDGKNVTGNNDIYLKQLWEVNSQDIGLNEKWLFMMKGGEYRKWYGNIDYLIGWDDNARLHYRKSKIGRLIPEYLWYQKGITWSKISSRSASFRILPEICTFDEVNITFTNNDAYKYVFSYLNSIVGKYFLDATNQTLSFQTENILSLPIIFPKEESTKTKIETLTQQNIDISKEEWDSRETSWDFRVNELIRVKNEVLKVKSCRIEDAYNAYCDYWREKFFQLHANEEELNRLFIDIYGLRDELTPDVPLEDITILKNETKICIPKQELGNESKNVLSQSQELGNKSGDRGELIFQADEIIKQFISYAVGVMFGRYSLDHKGLHIADMGVSLEEANEKFGVENPTFEADDDNVIPVLNGDWFTDDISERFLQFVKVTFGQEHYEENVQFIENAIGKSIRKYFVKDFYADHVKRYKKRPIYWMFSSPKGSFQALIYMHRYKSDTVSVILNDYLRNFITKLEATKENLEAVGISASATKSEKSKALKEIEKIKKMLKEFEEYERDILYPLATKKIEIDLDDGVKHNYPLFGKALKKVTGLS